jgi:hypothetical protein
LTPEGRVKAAVNRLLKPYIDAELVYKFMPVQTGYGRKTLDYLLCVVGHFIAIETKKPGGALTGLQLEHKREIEAAGGKVFKVDGDLTELRDYLKHTVGDYRKTDDDPSSC